MTYFILELSTFVFYIEWLTWCVFYAANLEENWYFSWNSFNFFRFSPLSKNEILRIGLEDKKNKWGKNSSKTKKIFIIFQ